METYKHRYSDVNDLEKYDVIECIGESWRPVDKHNEEDWVKQGNIPEKVTGNKFISIVDNKVILDKNMEATLAEEAKERSNTQAIQKLSQIDLRSIRGIREWIAQQPTATKIVTDFEAEAITERAKILETSVASKG